MLQMKNDRVEELLKLSGLLEKKTRRAKMICDVVRMRLLTKKSREEICYEMQKKYKYYISLSTYHRMLREGLNKMKKYIEE